MNDLRYKLYYLTHMVLGLTWNFIWQLVFYMTKKPFLLICHAYIYINAKKISSQIVFYIRRTSQWHVVDMLSWLFLCFIRHWWIHWVRNEIMMPFLRPLPTIFQDPLRKILWPFYKLLNKFGVHKRVSVNSMVIIKRCRMPYWSLAVTMCHLCYHSGVIFFFITMTS